MPLGTTAHNQVSFTPADLAAGNIVAISGVADTVGETYHVTRDEYATLLEAGGFTSTTIVPTPAGTDVITARPA